MLLFSINCNNVLSSRRVRLRVVLKVILPAVLSSCSLIFIDIYKRV